MTVQEVYDSYRIMPILQLHQLRVAALGKTICDHFDRPLDTRSIVLACLFHDMANIIKSDLGLFPDSLQPQGRDYWEQVKREYIERYGESEHDAALMIAGEIGLPEAATGLIEGIGFSKLEETRDQGSFELKIVEYSDCRVSPYSITDMTTRLEDARVRYADRYADIPSAPTRFNELMQAAHAVEEQIFEHTDMRPEDLTEEALRSVIEELREYKIA